MTAIVILASILFENAGHITPALVLYLASLLASVLVVFRIVLHFQTSTAREILALSSIIIVTPWIVGFISYFSGSGPNLSGLGIYFVVYLLASVLCGLIILIALIIRTFLRANRENVP